MQELYNKIKKYSLEDILKIEESDRQFIALKELSYSINNIDLYLLLIIVNSIICYQLSGKGEDYWEEFSHYFSKKEISFNSLINELANFISNSKNNKRFVDTKIKRINKLKDFCLDFEGKSKFYYENMTLLRDDLSKIMNQKKDAKTITFSVKMFGYGARNVFPFVSYPRDISIPIDSRLINLFEKYKGDYSDINLFYKDLSEKIGIPSLHFDALVWVNYDKLIND